MDHAEYLGNLCPRLERWRRTTIGCSRKQAVSRGRLGEHARGLSPWNPHVEDRDRSGLPTMHDLFGRAARAHEGPPCVSEAPTVRALIREAEARLPFDGRSPSRA